MPQFQNLKGILPIELVEALEAEASASDLTEVANGGNWLVFRPGGVRARNVYADWNELYGVLQTLDAAVVQFDDSVTQPITFPDGTYDMSNVRWRGDVGFKGGDNLVRVQLDDGATFTNLERISCLKLINNAATSSPILVNTSGIRLDESTQIGIGGGGLNGTGTVSCINVDGVPNIVDIYDGVVLGATSGGAAAITTEVGAVATIQVGNAILGAGCLETNGVGFLGIRGTPDVDAGFDIGSSPATVFVQAFPFWNSRELVSAADSVGPNDFKRVDTSGGPITI